MQRSLGTLLKSCVFAGSAALAATLTPTTTLAESIAGYETGFLRQADRALARNQPDRALAIVADGLERNLKQPHRADAHGLACRAHLRMDQPARARGECRAAIELDRGPSSWRYLNNLGVAELELGDYSAAEAALSRAVAIANHEKTPRRNLRLLTQLREARDVNEQIAAGGQD